VTPNTTSIKQSNNKAQPTKVQPTFLRN